MDRSAEDALKQPFKRTSRTQTSGRRPARRKRVPLLRCTRLQGGRASIPAPLNPAVSANERYHFCLEHVREYNKAWNYFEGMTPGAVERDRLAAMTWDRPTWRFR